MNNDSAVRVGLYIDEANLSMNGGRGMRYDVLREFACRGGAEPVRLNTYVSYDAKRAEEDLAYRKGQHGFHSALRDFGFKVIQKPIKWYTDDNTGERYAKGNVDLDLAVDALLQSERLDRVVLGSGDGDFVQVVRALQNHGCRVEVIAFDSVSRDLQREADMYFSGYLIPGLVQPRFGGNGRGPDWGEAGSRVRGTYFYRPPQGSYGFLRFLNEISLELWKTDTRQEGSPYETAFCHDSELPPEVRTSDLPSRDMIFEFELTSAPNKQGWQAVNAEVISGRGTGSPPPPPPPPTPAPTGYTAGS